MTSPSRKNRRTTRQSTRPASESPSGAHAEARLLLRSRAFQRAHLRMSHMPQFWPVADRAKSTRPQVSPNVAEPSLAIIPSAQPSPRRWRTPCATHHHPKTRSPVHPLKCAQHFGHHQRRTDGYLDPYPQTLRISRLRRASIRMLTPFGPPNTPKTAPQSPSRATFGVIKLLRATAPGEAHYKSANPPVASALLGNLLHGQRR